MLRIGNGERIVGMALAMMLILPFVGWVLSKTLGFRLTGEGMLFLIILGLAAGVFLPRRHSR